jgi:hypothetical protein
MTRAALLALGTALFLSPLLIPLHAYGQGGDSGSINGYVYDQTGNPLKGVRVSATSSTQIGGEKIGFTNDEGSFRIRSLIPGTFEIKVTAPGLQPLIQKDIRVGITAPVELNLQMDVKTAVEEIKVVQKAPLVSTSRPNVAEEFGSEFVEALPHHARDNIHRDMLGSVAGAVSNRMRGGSANQTIVTQDGFDMGPPGKTISPALKSSAAFEIQTAGYGADNPTAAGGILNLVTRSGSNKFEFEFNATAESNSLQFFRDSRDPRSDTYYYVINPMIAGPIIKDKLWFFFNTETHITQDGRQRDAEGVLADPIPKKRFIQKGSTKLTWQVTSRNKLSGIVNYELPNEINRVDGLGVEQDAQETRHTQRIFLGFIWESVLRDDLIFRSQIGGTYLPEHIYPGRCDTEPVTCDNIPSITQTFPRSLKLQNDNNHTRTDVYGLQLVNQVDWFVESKTFGEHNVQVKDRFYAEQEIRKVSHPGDALYEINGNTPAAMTTYYANDPRYEPARYGWFIGTDNLMKNVVTASDTWKPTHHLTVTPSLSYVWAKGGNSVGDEVINAATWAPGIATVWDATHDGKTALRASLSNYVDLDVGAIARHTIGSQVQQRCLWNPVTNAYDASCVYSGGAVKNTIGLPCGPSGIDATGKSCRTPLEVPRTWEVTAGGEREVIEGVALSFDYVHRRYGNQYEINETNRVWLPSGSKLDTVGAYRNGRNETISDLGTPDGAYRTYDGATFGVVKREGRLKTTFSYTWSQLVGTVFNGTSNAWGDVPGRDIYLRGYLPDDHRHELKLTLSYSATPWLSFGSRTTYMSGMPYDRLSYNVDTGGFDQYRAQRGNTAGPNLNDPTDDRGLRLPDQLEVNVQARASLAPFIGKNIDLYVDVLNALGLRTVTAIGTNDGQDFGVAKSWMDPFRIRLGVNYRY